MGKDLTTYQVCSVVEGSKPRVRVKLVGDIRFTHGR